MISKYQKKSHITSRSNSKLILKLRSSKSTEYIYEKGDGPYRDFGHLSLFSDPIDLAKTSGIIENGAKYVDCLQENLSKPIIIF